MTLRPLALAVAVLFAAVAARAAAAPKLLKSYFGDRADAVDAPATPAHRVVAAAVARRAPAQGHWQAIARPKNNSPRGPHVPVWTHQCYATPVLAEEAAIAACERENLGFTCTAEAYVADRCDR